MLLNVSSDQNIAAEFSFGLQWNGFYFIKQTNSHTDGQLLHGQTSLQTFSSSLYNVFCCSHDDIMQHQSGKVFVRTLIDNLHIFSPKLKLKSSLSFSFAVAFSLILGHLSQFSFHPLDHGVAQPCVPFRKLLSLSLDVLWMGGIVSGTQRERESLWNHTQ